MQRQGGATLIYSRARARVWEMRIAAPESTVIDYLWLNMRCFSGLSAWNHNARGFLDHDKPQLDLNTELRNFLNKNVAPENLEGGKHKLIFTIAFANLIFF